MTMQLLDGKKIRKLRLTRGESQSVFWHRIEVTQSGGSRYESGRGIPVVVLMLLTLAYGSKQQAESVLKQITPE